MDNESVIAKGNYERIGMEGSFVTHKVGGEKYKYERNVHIIPTGIEIEREVIINLARINEVKRQNVLAKVVNRLYKEGYSVKEILLFFRFYSPTLLLLPIRYLRCFMVNNLFSMHLYITLPCLLQF